MKFTNFGKKLFAFIAVLTFGLVLVSCGGGNQGGGNEQDELKAQHQANVQAVLDAIFFDETLLGEVKGNMTLVQINGKYPDVKIEWASSEADLIAADGSVVRPALDDPRAVDGKVEVTLTVTASQGEAKGTKTFKAYVLGEKKVSVNTIKAAKISFYQLMKEAGIKYNDKFDDTVQVEFTGKVELIASGSFVINDGTDTLLIYTAPNGIAVGDTVKVSGSLCTYYGLLEVKNASFEKVANQEVAAPVFEETTVSEYIAEIESALDANGKIVDTEKFRLYSTCPLNLYAKLIKTQFDNHESYALQDPNDANKQVIIYYTSVDAAAEAKLNEHVGKYVNIDVYTNDTKNSTYRVLYAGTEIKEAGAPDGLTDAQKVASALGSCSVATKLTEDLTLPVVEGVVWSLKETYAAAVIENGVLKVTRPENGAGNAKVVLVATATFGTESDSKEIEVEIVEKEDSGIKVVTEFDAEKTYKLGLFQTNLGKQLWVTGAMDGYYGALSENVEEAADIKVIVAEGGYKLQLTVNGTISYLMLVESGTHTNVKFATEAEAAEFVWVHDIENNAFKYTFGETSFFLGTSSSYKTLSANKYNYLSTSFIAHLYEVKAQDGGNEEQPPVQTGDVLADYVINNAMPAGLTYISNNPDNFPNPAFYDKSGGGLKMNYVNMGVQTAAFAAQSKVVVTLNVAALNDNSKTNSGKDAFTFYGLDANGNVVATASLANVVKGENSVTLTGEGIVSIKVVMTDYTAGSAAGKCANVNLAGVKVSKAA